MADCQEVSVQREGKGDRQSKHGMKKPIKMAGGLFQFR